MNNNISNYVWNLQCNNTEYFVANELLKMILQNAFPMTCQARHYMR